MLDFIVLEQTERSAKKGCVDSMTALAKCFLYGTASIQQDTRKGLEYLHKAAHGNGVEAEILLARFYHKGFVGEDGVEVEKDIHTAYYLFLNYEDADIPLVDESLYLIRKSQEYLDVYHQGIKRQQAS